MKEGSIKNAMLKVAKVGAGIGVAVVAAEVVAIGANAAFDDIDVVKDSIGKHFAKPEPPKKTGFFKKLKKGGK